MKFTWGSGMRFTYCHICKDVIAVKGEHCAECGAYLGEEE